MIAISLFPISIHADTIDSHITGRNIWYEPIQSEQNNGYALNIGKFVVEIILDGDYIGYMLPNYTIQYRNYYYGASPASWGSIQKSYQNRIFVNGSIARFEVPITWYSLESGKAVLDGGTNVASPYVYDSYTITSSNVTAYDEIQSLNEIIEILQDNNDIVGDIYNELLTVVSNTNLANQYLETISKMREWNFPFESFSLISNIFNYVSEDNIVDYYYENNYYIFPEIKLTPNYGNIGRFYLTAGKTYKLIMLVTNIGNINSFNNNFAFSSSLVSVDSVTSPNTTRYLVGGVYPARFIEVEISISSTNNTYLSYIGSSDTYIVPIYFNDSDFKYISTDFALLFGLSNNLLDNLNIIANGTSSSSSSSNDLDDATSQFQTDSNSLISIEDSFNSTMNSNLDNINPTFNMGSSFLASANWVSTQFNRIVNNTPFSSLITFGLTLGLGLLIIGKIRK